MTIAKMLHGHPLPTRRFCAALRREPGKCFHQAPQLKMLLWNFNHPPLRPVKNSRAVRACCASILQPLSWTCATSFGQRRAGSIQRRHYFPIAAPPVRSDDCENDEWPPLWHPGSAARGGSPSVKTKNQMCQPRFQNFGPAIKLGAQRQFELVRSRALKETRETV